MAFDGGFIYKLTEELKSAVDCHTDKIYQPSRDELVFLLRKKGFAKKLLISIRNGSSRMHFSEEKFENPDTPPMFCMLLRKYLSSARLIDIVQNGLERVVELVFSATNEMGDRVNLRLVCEFIGNQSNVILLDGNMRIIDAMRRSDIENSSRFIQPGAKYEYPQSLNKLNPLKTSPSEIADKISLQENLPLSRAILNTVEGLSPLVSREIAYRLGGDIITQQTSKEDIKNEIERISLEISSNGAPFLLKNLEGVPYDFSYTEINQYKGSAECLLCESYSELLDLFYNQKQNNSILKQSLADITKTVSNAKARIEKKLALRMLELEKCKDREKYRIYGELIKANIHLIESGSSIATVQNYYDPELELVRIPLNPALTPANNAARYFKEYKKTYTAEQTLSELTQKDREELDYLDSVDESITRCKDVFEASQIRDELIHSGYLKSNKKTLSKVKKAESFNEYTSREGYRIIVGKNNTQNDYLTCRLASKNDLWFHTKNIPGSHVLVLSSGGEVSEETILFAAKLAASNSRASTSSQVPVDYTPVKYVKKPAGAKPGMVIYTTNKTVYVTPEETI